MNVKDAGRNPREVIERIRTEDYLLDIEQESDRVKRGAKSLQKKLNNALELLSKDLYSKSTHFILELVQNADDNEYATDVVPQLAFNLSAQRLVLINNEIGFSERNVRALCSVGESSKARKLGYIGEKGIGFKSVFTVSNAPEIHSNGYHFRFDRTDDSNLLGYVVPEWCAAPEDLSPSKTVIVLPAAQGCEFGEDTFKSFDAQLLLFLSKLRGIELRYGEERKKFLRQDKAGLSLLTTELTRPGSEQKIDESRYVRVAAELSMVGTPDDKRPEVTTSTVVLAFPVDVSGAADPQATSQVFAFLPIRPVGFKFSIQADFIVSSSREDILTDRDWNKKLRDGIALAFKQAVSTFRDSEALALTYLKYIPHEGEVSDGFFRSVTGAIIAQLVETECLPSEGGVWKYPRNLRIADQRFRDLFPPAIAMELFDFDYVDHRVQGGSNLFIKLGVQHIATADYLDVFKRHGEWLKEQSTEWKARFFALIADLDMPRLIAGLDTLKCIPVNTGDLVVPSRSQVFFPLSRGKKFGFEHELVIIDGDLMEKAENHSGNIGAFFSSLGVKSDDAYHLISSHILPRHHGESWKKSEKKALLGHLRYIKEKLRNYVDGAILSGKSEAHALQAVASGIWVATKHHSDKWWFSKAKDLYLSKEYRPKFCIETFLVDDIPRSLLVSQEYLAEKSKDPQADANSWSAFLIKLGVCVSPRVKSLSGGDYGCSDELQQLLGAKESKIRRATLECLDGNWSQYSDCLQFVSKVGRNYVYKETQFAMSLRSTLAPTRKRVILPLSEAFYKTNEIKNFFGNRLAYVDAVLGTEFLDACGVTHRLDVHACLKLLRHFKVEESGTLQQLQDIYRHLERLWSHESSTIREAFLHEGLIRVKCGDTVWATSADVAWRSNGQFLDTLYPPLYSHYHDFSSFFTEKLGIPKELPTAKCVEALHRLEKIESIDERKHEAFAIYKRANRDLSPRFGRSEIPKPDWLSDFDGTYVFLNHRGDLVSNYGFLFANDVPRWAELFSDDDGISFLSVSFEDIPRIERLLDATGVPRISSSVEVELVESSGGQLVAGLTNKVRNAIPHVARVLYSKAHDGFDAAVAQGLFQILRNTEVLELSELKLSVKLGASSRIADADIASKDGKIFIRKDAKSIIDHLATEMCKSLDVSHDLVDIFARILMAEDADGIEDFLEVRGVGKLPQDVLRMIIEPFSQQTTDVELNRNDDGIESTYENRAIDPPSNEVGPLTINLPSDSTSERDRGDSQNSTLISGRQIPFDSTKHLGSERVRRRSSSRDGGGAEQLGATTASGSKDDVNDESRKLEIISEESELASSGITGEFTLPERSRVLRSLGGARLKRGRTNRLRTKTGRLMSYAAGAGDSELSGSDDPKKAAAREAIGKAAVDYFLTTQASRWKSLVAMPHNNPGFDVKAVSYDGTEEFIEVKGQGAGWTEAGVALTPTELMTAQEYGDRYWLCVVEHVQNESRRALYLLKNPYGLTQQFRFDSGWKSAAICQSDLSLQPEVGLRVEIPESGIGRIIGLEKTGRFYKLHVLLDDGLEVKKTFNPAGMKLFSE